MYGKISIIIPVYNVEHFLTRCVDSVVSQTYKDLDILLVDDGSTDNSKFICDEFAKRDSRIRVFHTPNQGQSAARNIGLDNVSGEFIGFVDADDSVAPDYFEKLLASLIHENASIACECPTNKTKKEIITQERAIIRIMGGDLKTVVWNKLFRTTILRGIHFPEGQVHEEIEFNRLYLKRVSSCVVIGFKGYNYTKVREGNTKSRFESSRLITFDQVTAFVNDLDKTNLVDAQRAVIRFGLVHFREMYKMAKNNMQTKETLKIIHRFYWRIFKKAVLKGAFKKKKKRFILSSFFLIMPDMYIKVFSQ